MTGPDASMLAMLLIGLFAVVLVAWIKIDEHRHRPPTAKHPH